MWLVLTGLALGQSACDAGTSPDATSGSISGSLPPSVILISIDTLRADRLSCYGYFRDTSPNLDGFSAEALVFDRAFAPIATTLPSHVSLLTGVNPGRHGVLGNLANFKRPVDSGTGLLTAPQMLRRAGYYTAAFVSARPVGSHTGIAVGFELFDEPTEGQRPAEETTERVIAWLESAPAGPLLLWVHYFDPHYPYAPPSPYDRRYTTDAELRAYLRANHFHQPDHPKVRSWSNHYDGEVRYLDDQLGRLLRRLRETELYETSAIVIVSDHGEGLAQHRWLSHGRLYNEQIHIPLMIRFPKSMGISATRLSSPASIIDILPTLDARLDLPFTDLDREQFEGIDLLDPDLERDYVWSERAVREADWEPGRKFALTGRRWKFFHLTDQEDQLFDLESDGLEQRNVIEEYPEVAAELRRRLLGQLRRYETQPSGLEVDSTVSPQVREQLLNLGYVD